MAGKKIARLLYLGALVLFLSGCVSTSNTKTLKYESAPWGLEQSK